MKRQGKVVNKRCVRVGRTTIRQCIKDVTKIERSLQDAPAQLKHVTKLKKDYQLHLRNIVNCEKIGRTYIRFPR